MSVSTASTAYWHFVWKNMFPLLSQHRTVAQPSASCASIRLFCDRWYAGDSGATVESSLNVVRASERRPVTWTNGERVEGYVVLDTHMAHIAKRSFVQRTRTTIGWSQRLIEALALAIHAAKIGASPEFCCVHTGVGRVQTQTVANEAFALINRRELRTHARYRTCTRADINPPESLGHHVADLPAIFVTQTGSMIAIADKGLSTNTSKLSLSLAAPIEPKRIFVASKSSDESPYVATNFIGARVDSIDEMLFDACCVIDLLVELGAALDHGLHVDVVDHHFSTRLSLCCLRHDDSPTDLWVGGTYDIAE
jgi:hypothetical protein